MTKYKIIYILGVSYSGSTILESWIGSYPEHWAIGEVKHHHKIYRSDYNLCECGKKVKNCSFWKQIGRDDEDFYKRIAEVSGAKVIVENSKCLSRLRKLIKRGEKVEVWYIRKPLGEMLKSFERRGETNKAKLISYYLYYDTQAYLIGTLAKKFKIVKYKDLPKMKYKGKKFHVSKKYHRYGGNLNQNKKIMKYEDLRC